MAHALIFFKQRASLRAFINGLVLRRSQCLTIKARGDDMVWDGSVERGGASQARRDQAKIPQNLLPLTRLYVFVYSSPSVDVSVCLAVSDRE